MKRVVLSVVLIVCLSLQSAYSQNISDFIRETKQTEGVYKISFGSFFLWFVPKEIKEEIPIKNVKGIEVVYCADGVSENNKRKVKEKFYAIGPDSEYEVLIRANNDEDLVCVWAKRKKDIIREFLVMVWTENDDLTIVKLKGKFKEEDIAELANELL